MVLYQNINVGQRVEVKIGNLIFRGVVKYKGAVVNKQGDWVGVALDRAGTYSTKVSPSINIPYISRRAGGGWVKSRSRMETSPLAVKGYKILACAQHVRGLSTEGSLSCHTCCDTGARFLSSQGLPYSNSFPHRNQGGWGGNNLQL